MKAMEQKYPDVKASIHAGESEEKNTNVRDTLAMGADRIGHGLNVIYDKQTMALMRDQNKLIEINLISNLLLGYVKDYQSHPFLHFLNAGIPVTLSTDDRGMWDSTMTDEYFVAVTEFDLQWEDVKLLLMNSITYAFVDKKKKSVLISDLKTRLNEFENRMSKSGITNLKPMPETRGFICRNYNLCNESQH